LKQTEQKGNSAVSWLASPKHRYEDRYRLLPKEISLIKSANRGELFAVFDGIGSASMGMSAAQAMADSLLDFFRKPDEIAADWQGLTNLLYRANLEIISWGFVEGTSRPLGGCAGTIAWCYQNRLTIFHAGDTVGMLLRPDKEPRTLTKLHEDDGGIYRYFGLGENLEIDVESTAIEDGDLILLMSDGVTKVFSTTEAAALVMHTFEKTGDLKKAAQELSTRSRTRKYSDDITVVLVEVEED
jgi:serine/threonine protein phosphatase PrpC